VSLGPEDIYSYAFVWIIVVGKRKLPNCTTRWYATLLPACWVAGRLLHGAPGNDWHMHATVIKTGALYSIMQT
jgi:hypothetical protein